MVVINELNESYSNEFLVDFLEKVKQSVDISYIEIGNDILLELKQNTIKSQQTTETIKNLKRSFDEKTEITKRLKESSDENIKSLKDEIIELKKQQNIAWAIDHTDLESFKYYSENNNNEFDSKYLAKLVLLSFKQGKEKFIDKYLLKKKNGLTSKKDFQDKFTDQIHRLTEVKPRYR